MLVVAAASACGCTSISSGRWAVPAHSLNADRCWESKSSQTPIDFTMLRQEPPPAYLIGRGDTLSVYIHGLFPPAMDSAPVVQPATVSASRYYPPEGVLNLPTLGLPVRVQENGTLLLPLLPPLPVEGLTLEQAYDKILRSYLEAEILQPDQAQISVDRIKTRVHRVLVVREDVEATSPTLTASSEVPLTKRGSGAVIDLRRGENDVMHALAATGGLPGSDAKAEVWVLRGQNSAVMATVGRQLRDGENPERVLEEIGGERIVRIPLRVQEGEMLDLDPADIVLNEGDILYVPERQDFFYCGGLMPGRQIPLPRDRDVDVIEAIAMAGGAVGGPLGAGGVYLPGNTGGYVFPPTRVLVLRKLPDGRKILVRVDLTRAMHDPKERINIVAGDMLMLHFKPWELIGNTCLNWLNFNMSASTTIK